MEILLLGTGAADGWPNPFCTCASCDAMRARREVRGQTAALVDDVLLLDCGPEAPRAAARFGRSLAGVRHIVLTHAHPDHTGPAALLWRSWARRREPLEVLGPAEALDACRDWVGPDNPVRLRELTAGSVCELDSGYAVRALRAVHGDHALLYDVTGPDGTRLLYATDTGPGFEVPSGAIYDVVLLEETFGKWTDHGTDHLDIETFSSEVERLRSLGAVTDQTRLIAVHLGHHNPAPPVLDERLAAIGASAPPDGTLLGRTRKVLVLGGARSGKSAHAESLLAGEQHVTYVATARPRPGDAEWTERVAVHRARRPATWRTHETTDIAALLRDGAAPLLVDCLALWLGDALERPDAPARIDELVTGWRDRRGAAVLVSNEVGSGVVPATPLGRRFRDELGRLNAAMAAAADEVWLVTAGIPQRLKGAQQ